MSDRPPPSRGPRKAPATDRRASAGSKRAAGSLQHLKDLMGRPLGFERRGGQLHLVLVERRRTPSDPRRSPTSPLSQLRDELRACLFAQENDRAAQVMRHLVKVHDLLGTKGWPGVQALPSSVLGKALVQAQMLAGGEPTPMLACLIDRLRKMQVAAEVREDGDSRRKEIELASQVEVSEATREEFEAMERSWTGSLPPGLVLPEKK